MTIILSLALWSSVSASLDDESDEVESESEEDEEDELK